MFTPWGKSDSIVKLAQGFSWVGTPAHGGFAVSDRFARKHLSPAALLKGERYGNYYFYEEDAAYSIVAWEIFGFDNNMPLIGGARTANQDGTQLTIEVSDLGKFTRDTLLKTLSTYHADYLIARNIEPDPEGLYTYNQHKLRDRLQADKSPDLVVSAVGDWHRDCPKGFVLVTTASDERWLVKADEYASSRCIVTLLSTFTNPISQGRNGQNDLPYKVYNDKWICFPTLEAANAYCNEVMRATGVVLAVEKVVS